MNIINFDNEKNLQKAALIQNNKQICYLELREISNQVALQFEEYKIFSGDVVLIILPNSIDLVILILVCLSLNVRPLITCSLNAIEIDIIKLNPKFIFFGKDFQIENLEIQNTNKTHLFNTVFFIKNKNVHDNSLVDTHTRLLVTSSGTTRRKKIIQLHEIGIIHNINSNIKALGIGKDDVTLMLLPIEYSYGLIAQLLTHLNVGATIVLCDETFYPLHQSYIINQFKITSIFTTPILLRKCVNSLRSFENVSFDSLKFITIGGSFAEKTLIEDAQKIFKCNIILTYGLAEAGPRVATNIIRMHCQCNDYNSVGVPLDGVFIEIDQEKHGVGNIIKNNIGRIKINSPSVTNGYLGEDENNIIPKKMVISQDVGYLDSNGQLYIVGRVNQYIETKKGIEIGRASCRERV